MRLSVEDSQRELIILLNLIIDNYHLHMTPYEIIHVLTQFEIVDQNINGTTILDLDKLLDYTIDNFSDF
jgi:hypothetical protein